MLRLNKNRIVENAAWIIGVKLFQAIVSFIINMLTARYLGPSNFGLISYASSLVSFVIPVMQLGIVNIIVQEFVQNPESEGETLGTAMILSMVSSFFCIIGVFSFSVLANAGERETIIVTTLYSILLVFQAAEVTVYWFQAKLRSKYSSLVSFGAYLIVSIYKVYLLVAQKNVRWFAISNAFDYLIIAIALLIIYRRLGGGRLSFSRSAAKRMLHRGKHYIISSMMVTIFAQTDKIMIKHMMSTADVGYYQAAITCASIAGFVFAAIIDSFRPVIFESKKNSEEEYEKNISRLYCIITYGSLIVCLFMVAFARLVVTIIYGVSYSPAIAALRIVCWYTTFSYYGSIRNIWILSEEKQKYLWIINLSGAAANVLLNAVLIPIIGINGAAIASLMTQFFTNVVIGWIIKPIRFNNTLMLRGLNPRYIMEMIGIIKGETTNG